MSRTQARWVVGGLWVAMFVVTHVPSFHTGDPETGRMGFDKIAHFLGFALLACMLRVMLWWRVVVIVGVLAVYGVVDELTQPIVGRTADPVDWVADMLGVGFGLLAAI
ncbi:MAG: VanZ family protein, partial [Planctomycetota bacterium]